MPESPGHSPNNLPQSSTEIAVPDPVPLSDSLLARRGVGIQVHHADRPYTTAIWDHPETSETIQLSRDGTGAEATYSLFVTPAEHARPHKSYVYKPSTAEITQVVHFDTQTPITLRSANTEQQLAVTALLRTGLAYTDTEIDEQSKMILQDLVIEETPHPNGHHDLTGIADIILRSSLGNEYSNTEVERQGANWTTDWLERVRLTKVHTYGEAGYWYVLRVYGHDSTTPKYYCQYETTSGMINAVDAQGKLAESTEDERLSYKTTFMSYLATAEIEFPEDKQALIGPLQRAIRPYMPGQPLTGKEAAAYNSLADSWNLPAGDETAAFWMLASHYMITTNHADAAILKQVEAASKLRYGLFGGRRRASLQEAIIDDVLRLEGGIPDNILRGVLADEVAQKAQARKNKLLAKLYSIDYNGWAWQ
ncbi:MAG: hypothetical protein WBP26_02965 [Candidatus Saccharimonadales bacterium]